MAGGDGKCYYLIVMKLIDSTYKVLYDYQRNLPGSEELVIWAIDMMEAGFDSEHLRELAGTEKPYDSFQALELVRKVFKELSIDTSSNEKITANYLYYLVSQAISGKKNYLSVLRGLREVCISEYYEKELMDFYLLCYAKEDLEMDTVQWYWPDADRGNIDAIIKDYFLAWKEKYESTNK
jgi:hypothetical protein